VTALRLLAPLAAQGNAYAETYLGLMDANGQGGPQDYGRAIGWYRKAADQGYAPAQFNLGVMFATGQGGPQDYGRRSGGIARRQTKAMHRLNSTLGSCLRLAEACRKVPLRP
jgi:TPR repeat protein